ncbi:MULTISPECIES: hypothetical protein [Shewanella]|jgi:hypothetical protein|uniref:hypothetical protein n=1 Tax=Shewanella TaxID=22 RepID=UPI00137BE65C|nr:MULTISPECIES: hypothetical protein [unclassified Shewanella]MBB1380593.1 hypothetical protein [Shewanella sp. SR41-2]MBO1897185.1 hypothetical protein [Shewanella sp. BF02_Schw]QHS11866.1 hypothetical protein GUY17_01430 [Shewanella sp. Arc9-LZ]|tara:strand:- start:120 stop:386 length:267 start_codon:yes stop_codon:yes gene_type:complete
MKKRIIQLSLLSSLVILTGCRGTDIINIGNNIGNADDNKNDTDYMILNVPRAILASDPCKYGHPDDIAACRKKKQDEADQLNESLKRK